jgi:uncharacterized protein YifE (UPF0438 family)
LVDLEELIEPAQIGNYRTVSNAFRRVWVRVRVRIRGENEIYTVSATRNRYQVFLTYFKTRDNGPTLAYTDKRHVT